MRANRHASACEACGAHVAEGAGALIGRPGRWQVRCVECFPAPPEPLGRLGWHHGALAALDLETTGVDPHTDRVVSFALLDENGPRTGLVNPGVPIPEAASAVHGLDAQSLAGAPSAGQALAGVLAWIDGVIQRRVPLVVFNAPYDLTMLRAEAQRCQLAQPAWDDLIVIDPYLLDWAMVRGELGPRRLTDVAAYYGVELVNAHDAMADARAALDVAVEIADRHAVIGSADVAALVADQRRWYAERADDWNSWARTAGRSLDDPAGWPMSSVGLASLSH